MMERWLRTLLLLMELLCRAGAAGETSPIIQEGGGATLSCDSRTPDQVTCDGTTWLHSVGASSTELVAAGTVKKERVNVTSDCSLVIEKVEARDAGPYTCRQYGGQDPFLDGSQRFLSVVSLTSSRTPQQETFRCRVFSSGRCPKKVQWLLRGLPVPADHPQLRTRMSNCEEALVWFDLPSPFESNLFSCEVTVEKNVQRFFFRPPVKATTTTTTVTPMTAVTAVAMATDQWWHFILGGAAALILLVLVLVLVLFLVRRRGNRAQMDTVLKLTSNLSESPADPESCPGPQDPGDELCYSSITYNKRHSHEVKGHADDQVTYSTVKMKASQPDACDLYAAVNKP